MLQLWELPAIPSNHHTVQPKGESEPRHKELEHARSDRGGSGSGGQRSGVRPAGTRRSSRCHVTQARGSRRESPSYCSLLQAGSADSNPPTSPNGGTNTLFNACTKAKERGSVRPPRREGETSEVANRESAAAGPAPNPGLARTAAAHGPGAGRAGERRDGGTEG